MTWIPKKVGNTKISQKGQIVRFQTGNDRQRLVATAFIIVSSVFFCIGTTIPLLDKSHSSVPWWLAAIQFTSVGFLCFKQIASPSDYSQINLETGVIESRIQINQVLVGSVNTVRIIHERSLFSHSIHLQDPQFRNILSLTTYSKQEVNQVIGFLKDILPPWEIRKQTWPGKQSLISRKDIGVIP